MLCSAVENRNIMKVKINQLIQEWQGFRKTFPLQKQNKKVSLPKGHFITFVSTPVKMKNVDKSVFSKTRVIICNTQKTHLTEWVLVFNLCS